MMGITDFQSLLFWSKCCDIRTTEFAHGCLLYIYIFVAVGFDNSCLWLVDDYLVKCIILQWADKTSADIVMIIVYSYYSLKQLSS